MKPEKFSRHAKQRMDQRAINPLMVDLISLFGKTIYQKGGTEKQMIPRKKLKQLRQALDHLEDVSLVVAEDSTIITVMHDH